MDAYIYRWVASGIILVLLKAAGDKVLSLWTVFAKIKDYPGRQLIWLNPDNPAAKMMGHTFPRPGMCGYIGARFSFYKKFGATSFASVNVLSAQPVFWLADAEAIKIVISDRHTFQKDVVIYDAVNIYGKNVLTVEGSDWRRHRSVAMSAFNEANIALVWAETMRIVDEWFKQLDTAGSDIPIDMLHVMAQITLLIIASAGFGKHLSLTADLSLTPGYKLTFQSAVIDSVNNVVFRALVPKWFYQLSSLIRVPYFSSRALLAQLAFGELGNHMHDLVASARAEIMSGERSSVAALIRNLVEANIVQDENSKGLTDAEVLSNIFIFLLGGHETSAHTLAFAFVLLALFPECQQKVYEEVTRVWPGDVPVTQSATNHKECMDKLEYTLAFLRETLRMYPIGSRLPRIARTDTVLPGTYFVPGSKDWPPASVDTGKFSMAVPSGSIVAVDIWAIHMNPLYWGEDVADFRPERFIDTKSYQWPRDAFLPFSGGPRSCIGQRFAIAEMIGIVARVVCRYRILVPDDLARKPFEQQKEALLAWSSGVATTPLNARVKLSRRI